MHKFIEDVSRSVIMIQPDNRLDSYSAPLLRQKIIDLVERGKFNLVIDLSNVLFLDSAGIAVLVNSLRRTRHKGGDTKLAGPIQPSVARLFDLTQFDQIFEMTKTAEDAIQRFQ